MEPLNPLWPLLGGTCIGLSAALYLLGNGRVAGISGMAAQATGLSGNRTGRWLSTLFLFGLLAGAVLAAWWLRAPELDWRGSVPILVAAGLLVGFGTRLGSGCTSGHGVCGMARGSPRSLLATAVFMLSAALTVYLTRHLIGGAP